MELLRGRFHGLFVREDVLAGCIMPVGLLGADGLWLLPVLEGLRREGLVVTHAGQGQWGLA